MDELNKHFNGNAYQITEGSKEFILMRTPETESSLIKKLTLNDFSYKSSDNETVVETLYLPYVQKLNNGTGPKFNYILIVKKPFKLKFWNKTSEKYTLHLSKLK